MSAAATESTHGNKPFRTPSFRLITAALLSAPLAWGVVGLANQPSFFLVPVEIWWRMGGRVIELPQLIGYLVLDFFQTGILVGIPLNLIVGWPVYSLFKRSRLVSVGHAMIGGLIPPGVLLLILSLIALVALPDADRSFTMWSFLSFALKLGIIGVFTGLIFWLIRRPDRDAPPVHMPQAPAA